MSLSGRVALITGGAGHIGSAMGEALAELGATIVVLDVDKGACERAALYLSDTCSVPTLALTANLVDEEAVRKVPARVMEEFGRLNIVVNCAALVGMSKLKGWTSSFLEQGSQSWRAALEVNLTAPFFLIQACTPALKASGCGSIVNIGSIYGLVGPDMRLYANTEMGNPGAYAASKGGLLQMTRWLATVLAPSVRVNAISLGGIARRQPRSFQRRFVARTPLKRMGCEEDAKGAIAYLASDLSAYVTGQNIVVDGGWTSW